MKKKRKRIKVEHLIICGAAALMVGLLFGCLLGFGTGVFVTNRRQTKATTEETVTAGQGSTEMTATAGTTTASTQMTEEATQPEEITTEIREEVPEDEEISWDVTWKYAEFSKIHSANVMLYRSTALTRKNVVIAVNAGHGTSGGSNYQTLCHPDGSPKVTGGSTASGSTYATAIAGGMQFNDGTSEATVTLRLAKVVKDTLLENGYDVLMIRESEDCQLDNIARTVYANENADCHIALHYDSTSSDKGFFYISVPNVESYRSMEPVASHWQEHNKLGASILSGMSSKNVKIWSEGSMPLDLTQTSYSTVPSVDLEVGDAESDYSQESLDRLSEGILAGLNNYFHK